ncbi:hypothetical protein HOC01_02065 [archaeon]|jgi:hypothetical protein|nr:hypothetical protein [archaeon]MBT6697894.1 hypothetical protein [archaeon]
MLEDSLTALGDLVLTPQRLLASREFFWDENSTGSLRPPSKWEIEVGLDYRNFPDFDESPLKDSYAQRTAPRTKIRTDKLDKLVDELLSIPARQFFEEYFTKNHRGLFEDLAAKVNADMPDNYFLEVGYAGTLMQGQPFVNQGIVIPLLALANGLAPTIQSQDLPNQNPYTSAECDLAWDMVYMLHRGIIDIDGNRLNEESLVSHYLDWQDAEKLEECDELKKLFSQGFSYPSGSNLRLDINPDAEEAYSLWDTYPHGGGPGRAYDFTFTTARKTQIANIWMDFFVRRGYTIDELRLNAPNIDFEKLDLHKGLRRFGGKDFIYDLEPNRIPEPKADIQRKLKERLPEDNIAVKVEVNKRGYFTAEVSQRRSTAVDELAHKLVTELGVPEHALGPLLELREELGDILATRRNSTPTSTPYVIDLIDKEGNPLVAKLGAGVEILGREADVLRAMQNVDGLEVIPPEFYGATSTDQLAAVITRHLDGPIINPKRAASYSKYFTQKRVVLTQVASEFEQNVTLFAAIPEVEDAYHLALFHHHMGPLSKEPQFQKTPVAAMYGWGKVEVMIGNSHLSKDIKIGARKLEEKYSRAELIWDASKSDSKRIVHGDFKVENIHQGINGIRHVLDYGQTRVGEPREDIMRYLASTIDPTGPRETAAKAKRFVATYKLVSEILGDNQSPQNILQAAGADALRLGAGIASHQSRTVEALDYLRVAHLLL